MKNYLTEFIGTFFLVLTIGLTMVDGNELAPLAIGAALLALVYMGGHISGAHYNPAVTLAIFLRGRFEGGLVAPYMVSQVAGAFVATLAVSVVTGSTFAPAPSPDATTMAALLVEILYTFALALVVLNVATADATSGNPFYGLAIGFTVAAGSFAGGPVSGGAFNPAVGTGPILAHVIQGGGDFGDLWLYLVGPFTGGALATVVFRLQHDD